jgi:proteasome alpha subunit
MPLADVLGLAVRVLGTPPDGGDEDDRRVIPAAQLEVAVLDRTRPRRAFRRLSGVVLEDLLGQGAQA